MVVCRWVEGCERGKSLNIKRGLKRIWIVGSVLVVVWVTGLTIQEFPEKPVYLYEGKNISKERLKKM